MAPRSNSSKIRAMRRKLVGLGRLERPTSPLSGVRSNHLSYRPAPPLYGSPAPNAIPHPPQRPKRKRPKSPSASAPARKKPDRSREKRNEGGGIPLKEALTKPRVFQAIRERPASRPSGIILRKEVIQPQVPLRL